MKYLTYLIILLFVLAFVGCNKAKEAPADVKETTTEAVEEAVEVATEAVEEAVEEAKEIVE
jgi:predicted small secreted protein